jgi:hypothetical protein
VVYGGQWNAGGVSGTNATAVIQSTINALTSGGKIFIKAGTYPNLQLLLPTSGGTWILKGEGIENTILQSASGQNLITTQSSSWDAVRELVIEDLTLESTGTPTNIVNADYWHIHFNRVCLKGAVTDSGFMLRGGGSGAPARPSSLMNVQFVNTGGLLYSYIARLWYEAMFILNPVFILAGSDIRGLIVYYGTYFKVVKPDILSWGGRDITVAAFYDAHGSVHASIEDIFYNYTGTPAPTYKLFRIIDTATTSVLTVKNIRTFDGAYGNLFYDAFTEGRTKLDGYLNGLPFKNGGTATFSGTGTQTTFTIAHGLAGTPKMAVVTAGSNDAKGNFYVTYDATNIYVTYATAPPSGTNNVVLRWYAEM